MPRQQGASGFPSMAGFLGENPAKRLRMQEPSKEKTPTSREMKLPQPEEENDEVWEELDEDVMDECMILATQMCIDDNLKENKKENSANHNETLNSSKRNENGDMLGDSGFSSAHNASKVYGSLMRDKSSKHVPNKVTKGNSYASRFNDFTPSGSQKLPSVSKSYQNSGRVYNSIPVKGNTVVKGTQDPRPGTSKDNCRTDSQSISKLTDSEVVKLQEELQSKQGEISLLRAELKRKETALASERLERCSIIDQAEKERKDKAALAALEADKKIKECNRTIEKLQDELHFKNREIQELTGQCRRLEEQQSVSPSQKIKRELTSVEVSPGKPRSSFKDRFDFSSNVKKKTIGSQTDKLKENKKRPKLEIVSYAKGRIHLDRQVVCLFSSDALERYNMSCDHSTRWAISDEWQNVLGKMVLDYEDSDSVQKQLLALSIQRLEEVLTMFPISNIDGSRSPPPNFDPIDTYEGLVVPALGILKSLTTTQCMDLLEKAIQVVCSHLVQISCKDVVVNDHVWPLTLQALSQLSRIITQIDKTVCEFLAEKLKAFCENNCTSEKLMSVLQLLQDLAHHKMSTESFCSREGKCFIGVLCSLINQQEGEHLLFAAAMVKWLDVVVTNAPHWLLSKCSCPSKLLATLLKGIYLALYASESLQGEADAELRKILVPTIRLLHSWSTKDSSWWEKIACLPHYTAVMGAIVNNTKILKVDRQTVDLLFDIYEVDVKVFENC